MFKKGIFLTIIFILLSSLSGYAFYTYTQQSGEDYFVGTGDKADALEDQNECRMILDALGSLLGHSKYNTTYPKDGDISVGYLGRLNYGVDASKPAVPVANDMYLATDTVKIYRCFVAGNWVQVYPGTIENNVIKTGAFTAGRIAKINNATGIIEQGTNTDTDVADAVTKKHSQNTDTDLDATFEATFVKKADTVNVLSDITSAGADIEDAVTRKHAQNTDTRFDFYNALSSDHTCSGDYDTQYVGESVAFGDLLYFDWATKQWKKTDADTSATMPGLRIALESRTAGNDCIMLVKGYIRDDDWDFTASMVYTSVTPGAMSSTAPTEAEDQLQRVGVAKSADILFFDPSIDVGEI